MSVNKYTRRKNGRSGDHDIIGIVLIIISAFLLICTILPFILGIVSEVLRNVLLGLFGLSAYAFLAFILAVGICLVMGRRFSVRGMRIALVCGMVLFLLLILQLATTHGSIDKNFGDYMIDVYSAKYTAGGVVFGLIAYGIKSINLIFAYILFSLCFVVCGAFLGLSIYKEYKADDGKAASVADNEHRTRASFTDDVPPQRVHMHTPTKLFVENILPENDAGNDAEEEDLGSLGDTDKAAGRNIDQTYAFKMLYDSPRESQKVSAYDEQFLKSKAQAELYVADYYNSAEQGGIPKNAAPLAAEASPDIHQASVSEIQPKKPDKILHESHKLPDIVIPKQKEDDNYVNPNKIINTDEALRGGIISQSSLSPDEGDGAKKSYNFYSQNNDSGIIRDNSASSEFTKPYGFAPLGGTETGFRPEPVKKEPENLFPIINADVFSRFVAEVEPKENISTETENQSDSGEENKHIGLFDSFSAFGGTALKPEATASDHIRSFKEQAGEPEKSEETRRPEIIRQSDLYSKPESDPIKPLPEDTSEPPIFRHDPPAYAPEQPVYKSDAFVIDDNAVDMSEKQEYFEDDNSGYYVTDIAEKNKRERKPKVLTGQMDFDNAPSQLSCPVDIPQANTPYVYSYPPLNLLNNVSQDTGIDTNDIESKSRDIEEVLASLKFPAKVVNVISGPTVTRYELQPQSGIPVRKILSLDKDLEFTLARGAIRIEAPVANKQAIGIEVANNAPTIVNFKEIIESPAFSDTKSVLPLALGKDIGGDSVVRNLEKMPHLLIAGTTGTGKSVCLNTLILSLVFKCSPEEVRIILVDPKQVEFTLYHELPHLLLRNPITDVEYAINALEWLIDEMNRRYDIFSNLATKGFPVRNLAEYNNCSLVKERKAMKLPYIVMIVDELADLMTTRKKDVENRIRIITQKSRASGIHLVLATQRPSVDVITGTIKINLPSRIAFKVTSNADSRTILDQGGAEALLGNGDMLLMSSSEPIRLQGAYVSNDEIVNVVEYIKKHNEACFDENIEKTILSSKEQIAETSSPGDTDEESADEKLFPDIMRCLITNGTASTSLIQRRFSLGYSRASRIIDTFEQRKWVGPSAGAKPREVYMTESQFEAFFNRPFNE